MKKLIFSKKAIEILEKNGITNKIYKEEAELSYNALITAHIAKFRFYLHKIVELDVKSEFQKELIQKQISENNFTSLILLEYLKIK